MEEYPNYALFCWVKEETYKRILEIYKETATMTGLCGFPIILIRSETTPMDFIRNFMNKCPLSNDEKVFLHRDGKDHNINYAYISPVIAGGWKVVGNEFESFVTIPKR